MTDWEKIKMILDRHLEVREVKKPEVNKARYKEKQNVIDWTVAELKKGALAHGTPAYEESGMWSSDYWTALKERTMERDGNKCQICGGQGKLLEVHHIMPKYLNGHNHPRNLITLCDTCHDEVHRVISKCIVDGIAKSMENATLKFGKYSAEYETLDKWVME